MEGNNAVAQLWSEGPLPDERVLWPRLNWPLTPRMHVAILHMETKRLFLIKGQNPPYIVSMACGGPFACSTSNFKAYFLHTVKSEPTISRDMAEPGKNKILLQDVEAGEIALDPGIPMDIFSPPVTYERQPEVKLTLGVSRGAPLQPTPGRTGIDSNQTAEESAIEFWDDFISFQDIWQDLREQECRESTIVQ